MTDRATVLRNLAGRLVSRRPGHPLRVGIDGRCGSGKSTFARELTRLLTDQGATAVHLDSDGFHNVRALRQLGSDSARGYYENAYDFDSLAERVLRPLGPGGSFVYATKVHDLESDAEVRNATAEAVPHAVVIFACTFIQREGLRHLWDEVIYLETEREVATLRGVERDVGFLGGRVAARAAYERRYMAACDIYLAEERPAERADIVIAHDDPQAPVVLRE